MQHARGAPDESSARLESLRRAIEHASHLLPAQGPITVFIHHNTLHAFEDLSFEEAVIKGAETFGCHPYLPEDRYREELRRGRIRPEDIEAVLIEHLGDDGDTLLGFLGTRFRFRQAVLEFALRIGPAAELRWIIEESDALRRFREDVPRATRNQLVLSTRHWFMRDLRNGFGPTSDRATDPAERGVRAMAASILEQFDKPRIEHWTDEAWEAFCLHLLWWICRDNVSRCKPKAAAPRAPLRHRDLLLEATGQDSDELVHGLLIRFCAAFVDQGFSSWSLPDRKLGFFRCFRSLYSRGPGPAERWLREIRRELDRLGGETFDPLASIDESLQLLGVADSQRDEFVAQTLLALRGWAGMIWQIEDRGDRVAHPAPKGSLVEFLAVRLMLDRLAVAHAARQAFGYSGPLDRLRDALKARKAAPKPPNFDRLTFQVFQLAQLMGWTPENLSRLPQSSWELLVGELESFSGWERRRLYHLAFERRYRIQTLDALCVHCRRQQSAAREDIGANSRATTAPAFQVVCCIDEREESFRRHLEEIAPECETFATAGFFAVAMYYRGAADAHFSPLCPVIIKPGYYVRESVAGRHEQEERQRRKRRRTIGTVTHRVHVGSRTFAGGWLAAILGSLASIPLVMRILFPRTTAQFRRLVGGFVRTPMVTQLQLERAADPPGPDDGHVGYSVDEMATVVERVLRDIGLTQGFSRLVIVAGHGSSSLNNPHESAHDCGACGGGRGGPNARAFSQMANDPRVRAILADRGLTIPDATIFVGAYHNTCDDSLTWYDVDRVPESHRAEFDRADATLDLACRHSAHERCRRFETAELGLDVDDALKHVEGRAEDLSQVRPEYGHATNALCFVGRREWSRGLYLDRRAFLQSYDLAQDDEQHAILTRILQAVIPV